MKIATPKRRVTLDAAIDRFVIHGTLTAPSGDRPDFHGWLKLNTALEGMLDTGADDARNDSPTLCMDVSYQTSDVSAELCGGAAEMTGVESDRSVVPIALERGCARGVEREHVRSIGRALPVPTAHASTEAGPAAGRAVGASPALAGTQARAAPCRTGGEHRIRAPHAPARASGFAYGDAAIGAGVAGGVALLETIGSPSRANAKSAHAYRAAGRRSSALAASRRAHSCASLPRNNNPTSIEADGVIKRTDPPNKGRLAMISKTTPQPSAATAAGRPPAVGGFALLAGVMAAAALSIPMTAAAATPTHRVRVAAQRSVPVKPHHGRPSTAPNRPKQARHGVHARIASACESTAPDVYLRTLNYNTTWVGGSLRLDATTTCDIEPSPFYTELYDATTGTYLKVCGTGTDCYANVSQAVATTHRFIAYVTTSRDYGFPPATMQRYSNPTWITWSNSGWQTALNSYQGNTTFTAFANRDVGLTPYRIEIYEFTYDQGGHITANTLLKACGSGTACTLANAPYAGKGLVAFIAHRHISLLGAYYGTVIEPNDIQANSEVQQEVHPIG